jgi:ATP-dependent RNA helicase DeaD
VTTDHQRMPRAQRLSVLADLGWSVRSLESLAVSTQAEPHTEQDPDGFAALGLRDELLAALDVLGYEEPTPIQRQAIPHLLAGADVLGQAATGTGKTAAFALPVLQNIDPGSPAVPTVLVLTPTRELAVQVSEAMFAYGKQQGVKVAPIYGGQPIGRQLDALRRGVHIVVATPGRAIDHLKRGSLDLDAIQTVILDEADEMLDMGFTEDIELILDNTPSQRQTVMFSATMPPRITSIAKRHQNDPVLVKISAAESAASRDLTDQKVYVVHKAHKASALGRILDIENPTSAIVFCKTRTDVDELTVVLNGRGFRAEALHGGMDQAQRDRVMGRLRDGTAELLVATDVAARGLDVDTLTHVVNYDIPSAPESYVHRIGRVGRAGREGVAITLVTPRQKRLLQNIERLTKQTITIHRVPTVADLRERQVTATVDAVREALTEGDLDDYQGVFHELKGEDSDRNIALAAIKLVHAARGAVVDEPDIPDASDNFNHDDGGGGGKKQGRNRDRDRGPRREGGGGRHDGDSGGGKPRPVDPNTGFVYIGVGSRGNVRPGDLVGAIANETGLSGRDIGPIRISDHYSVVGVPDGSVDEVVDAIKRSTVKGKKAKARRYVD